MAINPANSLGNNQYTAHLATRLVLSVLHIEDQSTRFTEASVSINTDVGNANSANVVLLTDEVESVVRAKVVFMPEDSYQIRAEIRVTVNDTDLTPRTAFTDGHNQLSGIGHSAPAIFETVTLPLVTID